MLQSTVVKLTLQSKDFGVGCNICDPMNFNCSQHMYLTLCMVQNAIEGPFSVTEVEQKQSSKP